MYKFVSFLLAASLYGSGNANPLGYLSPGYLQAATNPFLSQIPWLSTLTASGTPDGPFGSTPDKLPFEAYFRVQNLYVFFGLALLIDNPPDMIPDPAFSPVPVALNNLFVVQNATGPCGPVEWVAFSLLLNYAGPNGSRWAGRTTQSWSTNPGCCGSGTYIEHPCQVAVFKWTQRADKTTDLAIYDPSNTESPILTIKGLWYLPIGFPVANTTTWQNGPPGSLGAVARWISQDVATLTKGTRITGHVLDNFDYDNVTASAATFEGFSGPAAAKLPGFLFPVGFSFFGPTQMRIQYWEA